MRLRKKIILAKKDLEMCMENQSFTGIDISAMFGDMLPIQSEKKDEQINTNMTKEDLIHGTAEDGEPTW